MSEENLEETTPLGDDEKALTVVDTGSELQETVQVDHSKLFIWVADTGNDRIQKFDGNGKLLLCFGKSGGTRPPYMEGDFKTPSAVTLDNNDNIWVADTGCHRIQKFYPDGDFLFALGSEGWGQEKFYWPEGILAESTGTILVADSSNHCVKRYDDDGDFLMSFGLAGDFDGFMKFPTGLALDKEGNIYVADRDNQRIQIFNEDGQFMSKVGQGMNFMKNLGKKRTQSGSASAASSAGNLAGEPINFDANMLIG